MYIKFCNFGPYADVKVPGKSVEEPSTDVYRKVRLYKRISAVFTLLSLLLLAAVLALALKLYEVQSIQNYPERPDDKKLNCSLQLCETLYPSTQAEQKHVYQCPQCGKGWLKFKDSCYFLSKERLSWQESRETCQNKGGDLVVIEDEHVQEFLNQSGGLLYWIGLRYAETHQWVWVNSTALTQSGSYWDNTEPKPDAYGSCALLKGRSSVMKNWITNPCVVLSHYICQRG